MLPLIVFFRIEEYPLCTDDVNEQNYMSNKEWASLSIEVTLMSGHLHFEFQSSPLNVSCVSISVHTGLAVWQYIVLFNRLFVLHL